MRSKKSVYKRTYKDGDSPGLDAINSKEKEIYGNQEPTHWATVTPYELGGEDPLWAVECFVSEKQQKHFHYVSLGFTNLWYDEEAADDEISGFGFELTFRYIPLKDDKELPTWPANFLQNVAKYVFKNDKTFDDFHYMSANGPLRKGAESDITAFAFYTDPELGEIETPNGALKFLQVYGLTTTEYNNIRDGKYTVEQLLEEHRLTNPLLITDLGRK